jgi:hypothetical protein
MTTDDREWWRNYDQYLKSYDWQRTRKAAIRRDNYRCQEAAQEAGAAIRYKSIIFRTTLTTQQGVHRSTTYGRYAEAATKPTLDDSSAVTGQQRRIHCGAG